MSGSRPVTDRLLNMRFLKWAAIVLPIGFLVSLDVLRQTVFAGQPYVFPGLPGLVITYVLIMVLVVLFSYTVFGFIARLQQQIVDQNRRLAALNEIARAAAGQPRLDDLLDTSLDHILGSMRAEAGLICLVDMEREEHSAVNYRGLSPEVVRRIQRAKLKDDPIAQKVVLTGRPVPWKRVMEDPQVAELSRSEGIRSGISAPLKSEGAVNGILVVATHQQRRFSTADLDFLAGIGGQLGLAIKNSLLYEQSQRQNQELEALLAVGKVVTSSLDTDELVGASLDNILAVTSAHAAEVWLVEGEGDVVLRSHRGGYREAFLEQTRFKLGEGIPGIAAQTGEPIVVHDLPSDARFLRGGVVEAGFHTYCALPLRFQNKVVGVLAVASNSAGTLDSPRELRLLEGIGEWLAIAIENAHLYQQVGNLAVLEERERIAREMHDGLAQVLAYINAQTSSISRHLSDGRHKEARQEIHHLREAARGVYADVREAILGLRLAGAGPGQIWETLHGYTETFSDQTGIPVFWKGMDLVSHVTLESAVETQLMRIIQEALTNVRKHAAASKVILSINHQDGSLSISVEDDGKGFDTARIVQNDQNRFGLHTMRERAQSVGGTLRLESTVGMGTTVTVSVPAQKTEETRYAGT